jgi:hypothetical protein
METLNAQKTVSFDAMVLLPRSLEKIPKIDVVCVKKEN